MQQAERERLEIAAVSQLAVVLAAEGYGRLVFRELRTPPEPDCFCDFEGVALWIEVGHVYGTDIDARNSLGRVGRSEPSKTEQLRSSLIPLDQRILTPLKELIQRKCRASYKGDRTWLLIRSASPLWNRDDFVVHQPQLQIPAEHAFEQVWLLCGPRADFGALRLA